MSDLPLAGRIALVTGATRGIGRAAALALAAAGAQVVALGRTQGALEALDDAARAAGGRPVTLVPLDLLNAPEELDVLGRVLWERHGRLDVLVGSAAVLGPLTPVSHLEPQALAQVLAVNLAANHRLIRMAEPLLRASDGGRALFLTSGAAVRPRAYWGAYAASKAALEALVTSWQDELSLTPIRTCLIDPGAMRTKMRASAFPGEDPLSLPAPEEIGPLITALARPDSDPAPRIRFADWRDAVAA